ncbi:MAG: terminase family protein [Clostridia bacterium]|nr:terminase family protein [Clostridia bacterium]
MAAIAAINAQKTFIRAIIMPCAAKKIIYFVIKSLMQREDILTLLLQVEKEMQCRREADKLGQYNSGRKKHKKQLAFHKCKKRNRWVFGGNRSGKTECGAVEAIWIARGVHPYRKNRKDVFGWVVSLSQQVQRDVAQKKILYYLPKNWIEDITMLSGRKDSPSGGVIDQIKIKNVFGGFSTIGFKSCDQGREKFQGSSLDFVWFDEEPPQDVYEECLMRVMDKRGDIFGTMTPLKGLTFIYNEIVLNRGNNPEIWYEFVNWADNPFLPAGEIKLLESSLPQTALDSRKYGKFSAGNGLVYPEFDESVNVIKPFPIPEEWQDCISIDPGLNNPLAAHWYCVDWDGNVYVVAEHYAAGKDIDFHARSIKDISRRIGWHTDIKGRLYALIDSAANQRTLASSKSVAELFRERDILVNTDVNKDVFSGICRVKSFLGGEGAKLYVFSCCTHMIDEFRGYMWGEGDSPVKRNDHCMDELRYYIMNRPKVPRAAEAKSPIAEDKLRRIRRTDKKIER